MRTYAHTQNAVVYLGRGHCQPSKKENNQRTSQKRREENRSGTEQTCFAVFSSGSLSVFPVNEGSWGRKGREECGERVRDVKDGDL